jgi:predicted nucleic acid-binding protein
MKEKKDEKKPLDMTTEEAMNFLFPKEVVEELKTVVESQTKGAKANKNKGDNDNGDSSYIQNTP